jgi:hypothetical protein
LRGAGSSPGMFVLPTEPGVLRIAPLYSAALSGATRSRFLPLNFLIAA